jgi:HD superfamily phosphohydrolase
MDERMFDALAVSGNMPSEYHRRLRKVVTSAAILHDAGHTAFSHVGERVLQNALRDEYEAVVRILRQAFPDSLESVSTAPVIAPERHKLPAAAELMSALFVLSPSMEGIVPTLQHEFSPDECMMMMCGFILGRPWNLREGDVHYYWAKGIISGDLDCDKVDYVARDAYYAGIPTATDIDRLLSQLVAVKARDDISAPDLHYSFGRGNPTELQLFGIRPAGASALEMFVMTRSYLFERLYAHHKVRAAERLLQRLLLQRIQIGREDESWGLPEIFDLLYAPGGDDYVLGYLSNSSNEHFAQLACRILDRKLPARALAISATSMGTTPRAEATDVSTFLPWQLAEDELSRSTVDLESAVCNLLNLQFGKDIIVDWYLPNPIREDPDIWVSDPADEATIWRVSRYFNVEQLSNAYRSTKQVAWIFASPEIAANVAGAGAISLHRAYDLIAGRDAFNLAKIPWRSVEMFFDKLKVGADDDTKQIIANVESTSADEQVTRPTAKLFASALQVIDDVDEREVASKRPARQVALYGLPRSFYNHLSVANQVFQVLTRHCFAYYRHPLFKEQIPRGNEKRFHGHLLSFCESDSRCGEVFRVRSAEEAGGGEVDLIFAWKGRDRPYPEVVVELKSEPSDFESSYEAHAGQPFQYAGKAYSRVSILYVQFRSEASVKIADTFQARRNSAEGSPQVVLCLGQHAFADVPSAGGKTSVAT